MAAILIVEDDGLVACHTAGILRRAGHTPTIALDVRTALLETTNPPDLVLLDLGLPDMPGEDFLRWLRARPETAAIPVLLTTGRNDLAACVQAADRSGLTAQLLKPVSDDKLREAVANALAARGGAGSATARLHAHGHWDMIDRPTAAETVREAANAPHEQWGPNERYA